MEEDLSLSLLLSDPHHPNLPSHTAALHSVRKPPSKPWKKPEPPPPPKVYRVDPRGFRRLVQRLTGPTPLPPPLAASRPLRDTVAAPPPLNLPPPPRPEFALPASPLGFLPSPSMYSGWCSFPLLSPGTMASLDRSPGAII